MEGCDIYGIKQKKLEEREDASVLSSSKGRGLHKIISSKNEKMGVGAVPATPLRRNWIQEAL